MGILKGIKPEKLWYYFEEISKIPRCSGNEDGIRNYIVSFAKAHNLDFKLDKTGNVVVIKDASPEYKDKPVVILQAHMDMVCEKNSSINHDFKRDPITLKVKDNWLKADGTTLGADNGIGVAAMLALLDEKNINHGKIECLFTVEEETGLKGAKELETNMITGRYMINLDTEEAGTIYIGCAGGIESKILIDKENFVPEDDSWKFFGITITGLKGGHSGGDINKGRANALKLIARLLFRLNKNYDIRLVNIKGGDKHNAIPRECFAKIAALSDKKNIGIVIDEFKSLVKDEYMGIEDDISISLTEENVSNAMFSKNLTNRVINLMMVIPHGVLKMSKLSKDLVETSTNFAAVSVNDNIEFYMSHRSSVETSLEYVMDIHTSLSNLSDGKISFSNRYPAWQPETGTKLLDVSSSAMESVYGKRPEVKVIHAGLEAAIIKDKFKNMEIVSIGPTIKNPHSPQESVDIKTVELFWDSLLKILELIG